MNRFSKSFLFVFILVLGFAFRFEYSLAEEWCLSVNKISGCAMDNSNITKFGCPNGMTPYTTQQECQQNMRPKINYICSNVGGSVILGNVIDIDLLITETKDTNINQALFIKDKVNDIVCKDQDCVQPGLTPVSSSVDEIVASFQYISKVKYSFDSATFVKDKKPTLPFTLKLNFVASYDDFSSSTCPINITINPINCTPLSKADCSKAENNTHSCFFLKNDNKCYSANNDTICNYLSDDQCKNSPVCTLKAARNCVSTKKLNESNSTDDYISSTHPVPSSSTYKGPLPDCAFTGTCKDVNDLVDLGLRAMNYIFSFVAGLAFVMFIYGGFTWIFSFGNSEKVKKGQQIFVYAVIGLVIVFSAYILVSFLLTALNVLPSFRGIN